MQVLARFENYTLFRLNKVGKIVRRVVSTSSSKSADHDKIEVRDGNKLDSKPISEGDIISISERFESYGPSQAFTVITGESSSYGPEDVLHNTTIKEKSYTSTGDKLDFHWPIFKKLQDTNYGSIINPMTLHQVCSSRCSFCSTINRSSDDSISLAEAKSFVDSLADKQAEYNRVNFPEYNKLYKEITGGDISLKGLILSGGGQPNLWHGFEELVEYVDSKGVELGLITNGFPRNIKDSTYDKFKWIRLSITPPEASPHYINGKFEEQYIPPNLQSSNRGPTLGLSYVYGPWSSTNDLKRLNSFAESNSIDYVRALVDCNLARQDQLKSHNILSQKLLTEGLIDASGHPTGRIFHQLKYHMDSQDRFNIWDSGQCWLQSYNVFWDTTAMIPMADPIATQ